MKMISKLFLLFSIILIAATSATNRVKVSGKPIYPFTIEWSELMAAPAVSLGDIVIYNHNGDSVYIARNVKGVPFSTIKSRFKFKDDVSKNWTSYHFNFVAADGYTVSFSWSELFNSSKEMLYFVTSKNGKSGDELHDHVQIVVPGDVQTGRRYLKYLKEVVCSK